jgi:hypothetical protein
MTEFFGCDIERQILTARIIFCARLSERTLWRMHGEIAMHGNAVPNEMQHALCPCLRILQRSRALTISSGSRDA